MKMKKLTVKQSSQQVSCWRHPFALLAGRARAVLSTQRNFRTCRRCEANDLEMDADWRHQRCVSCGIELCSACMESHVCDDPNDAALRAAQSGHDMFSPGEAAASASSSGDGVTHPSAAMSSASSSSSQHPQAAHPRLCRGVGTVGCLRPVLPNRGIACAGCGGRFHDECFNRHLENWLCRLACYQHRSRQTLFDPPASRRRAAPGSSDGTQTTSTSTSNLHYHFYVNISTTFTSRLHRTTMCFCMPLLWLAWLAPLARVSRLRRLRVFKHTVV